MRRWLRPTSTGARPTATRAITTAPSRTRPRRSSSIRRLLWPTSTGPGRTSNKGDYDRAIADATEAIRLDPKMALAYVNRAGAYLQKGDYDRAIADATEAIQAYLDKLDYDRAIADATEAIQLDPKIALAYVNRAARTPKGRLRPRHRRRDRGDPARSEDCFGLRQPGSRTDKGDYDRAIADATEAIQLDPKIAGLRQPGRGVPPKGDYDRAIADATEAIRLDQKSSGAYFCRAVANVYAGSLPKAMADLNEASALNPKNAYAALWLDIVGQRSNVPSRLSQLISTIDMRKWPAPVIRLYLGQMTPEAVLTAAAVDADAITKKGQVCEANFYSGELALQKGAKEEATRLFGLAAADCPKGFIEWSAANAELKALGVAVE